MTAKVVVLWLHGAGENFYFPSYVAIGREIARRGYAFLTVNTRMHDFGTVLAYRDPSTLRGGTYWGVPSLQTLDIAAWIAVARAAGYPQVVLVGHSAGGAAARRYQIERNDPAVVGLALASVGLGVTRFQEPERLAAAKALVAQGKPQDFLPDVRISAATFLDYAQTPEPISDFYGLQSDQAGIAAVRCPVLIWFAADEGLGKPEDVAKVKARVASLPSGPSSFETAVIDGDDHLYRNRELQVADVLVDWMKRRVLR